MAQAPGEEEVLALALEELTIQSLSVTYLDARIPNGGLPSVCGYIEEVPDELKCLICSIVFPEPQQHEPCGKILCKQCLERNGVEPCPGCMQEKPAFYLDKESMFSVMVPFIACLQLQTRLPLKWAWCTLFAKCKVPYFYQTMIGSASVLLLLCLS